MFEKELNVTRCIRILVFSTLIICNMLHVNGFKKEDGIIYILVWTTILERPFNAIKMGRNAFGDCEFKNCFLTENHGYFSDILEFDVILIDVMHFETPNFDLPSSRSNRQIYIMYGMESAMFHYIPTGFNRFFNLSFTYKLSSNITLPYVEVKDKNDNIIGPNIDMYWMKLSEMNEPSDYVKNKLKNKRFAATWLVSNCHSPWRNLYVHSLKSELSQLGHTLDIDGRCGAFKCQYENNECYALIERDYYFYLSFENSFAEDYVTEKILNALEHFAVPVVYGGADYSRFMPEGIYIDANVLEPYQLALKMIEIINDKNKYYEFFKWHGHYSFRFTGDSGYHREVCRLCAVLNHSKDQTNILEHIVEWWNEEQPIWPTPPTSTSSTPEPPNAIEKFVLNVLEFLDPSSDDY